MSRNQACTEAKQNYWFEQAYNTASRKKKISKIWSQKLFYAFLYTEAMEINTKFAKEYRIPNFSRNFNKSKDKRWQNIVIR